MAFVKKLIAQKLLELNLKMRWTNNKKAFMKMKWKKKNIHEDEIKDTGECDVSYITKTNPIYMTEICCYAEMSKATTSRYFHNCLMNHRKYLQNISPIHTIIFV